MARKIRLIDEEPSDKELDTSDFNTQIMEIAKSMDWKLWELLQTMQRLEKGLTVVEEDDSEK